MKWDTSIEKKLLRDNKIDRKTETAPSDRQGHATEKTTKRTKQSTKEWSEKNYKVKFSVNERKKQRRTQRKVENMRLTCIFDSHNTYL